MLRLPGRLLLLAVAAVAGITAAAAGANGPVGSAGGTSLSAGMLGAACAPRASLERGGEAGERYVPAIRPGPLMESFDGGIVEPPLRHGPIIRPFTALSH
jgi:hypothetical protein